MTSIPSLHLVTDDRTLLREGFLQRAAALAAVAAARGPSPGVALHLRGPGLSGRRLWELGAGLRAALRPSPLLLFVNDRVDVARLIEADGVHLPARGLPPEVARGLLPAGTLLGRSVHGVEEVEAWRSEEEGTAPPRPSSSPDYWIVGTLWPTGSHPGRPGAGPGRLTRVREALEGHGPPPPLIGIGGITPERVPEVLAAGGSGVAVLSGVWDADDPGAAARRYLDALAQATS